MHAGNRYTLGEVLYWTRRDIYILLVWCVIPTVLYELLNWRWLGIPWVPIAMIGTAAAFLVGFRNTQTYGRLWEARQIYGSIVNTSRSWGMLSRDFVTGNSNQDELKKHRRELIYRHIAWLTAMRFQLRERRAWENMNKASNIEYANLYSVNEWNNQLPDALKSYLSEEEHKIVLSKHNKATHIISLQSKHIKELKENGLIEPLNYVEMEKLLIDLYEQQGRCERIKNFPYPRQFATVNQMFVRLFASLIPYGMLNEFDRLGDWQVWLTIPFSVIVAWIFMAIERVGESTENPFEGGANDVPITAMSRTIEIDLREMLDEKDLPPALAPIHKILM